jgi:hypothetical protein
LIVPWINERRGRGHLPAAFLLCEREEIVNNIVAASFAVWQSKAILARSRKAGRALNLKPMENKSLRFALARLFR